MIKMNIPMKKTEAHIKSDDPLTSTRFNKIEDWASARGFSVVNYRQARAHQRHYTFSEWMIAIYGCALVALVYFLIGFAKGYLACGVK
jgi:hypothetical protein